MKKLTMILCLAAFVSGTTYAQTEPAAAAGGAPAVQKESAAVYTCSKCHMEAPVAGKCPMCGEEMQARHLIKAQDGKTYLCECPADCTCGALKEGDKTQCSCGKPAREVKGAGKTEKAMPKTEAPKTE
jgi:predicted RNA-binding Zn-ribbon protein involved in translation (DUF1610 family)